ncbi:MAG: hypothetical protein K0R03_5 [Moraxellaceae bacterium]|nr:hypothetical protein [Moraxellaceae bacterium]
MAPAPASTTAPPLASTVVASAPPMSRLVPLPNTTLPTPAKAPVLKVLTPSVVVVMAADGVVPVRPLPSTVSAARFHSHSPKVILNGPLPVTDTSPTPGIFFSAASRASASTSQGSSTELVARPMVKLPPVAPASVSCCCSKAAVTAPSTMRPVARPAARSTATDSLPVNFV